jgi:hypothetical protein
MDLTDMPLKNNASFKIPTDEKFPIREYTTKVITNEFGSALYIKVDIYTLKLMVVFQSLIRFTSTASQQKSGYIWNITSMES